MNTLLGHSDNKPEISCLPGLLETAFVTFYFQASETASLISKLWSRFSLICRKYNTTPWSTGNSSWVHFDLSVRIKSGFFLVRISQSYRNFTAIWAFGHEISVLECVIFCPYFRKSNEEKCGIYSHTHTHACAHTHTFARSSLKPAQTTNQQERMAEQAPHSKQSCSFQCGSVLFTITDYQLGLKWPSVSAKVLKVIFLSKPLYPSR